MNNVRKNVMEQPQLPKVLRTGQINTEITLVLAEVDHKCFHQQQVINHKSLKYLLNKNMRVVRSEDWEGLNKCNL